MSVKMKGKITKKVDFEKNKMIYLQKQFSYLFTELKLSGLNNELKLIVKSCFCCFLQQFIPYKLYCSTSMLNTLNLITGTNSHKEYSVL